MADGTIVPRPGVEANQIITLIFSSQRQLDQRGMGELESELNERFVNPQEMGEIAFVFRSRVSQVQFLADRLTIQTTAGMMTKDALEEVIQITENRLGVTVVDWELEATIDRKSLGVDET